jgi:RNase P/RNase MRP subunit p30
MDTYRKILEEETRRDLIETSNTFHLRSPFEIYWLFQRFGINSYQVMLAARTT